MHIYTHVCRTVHCIIYVFHHYIYTNQHIGIPVSTHGIYIYIYIIYLLIWFYTTTVIQTITRSWSFPVATVSPRLASACAWSQEGPEGPEPLWPDAVPVVEDFGTWELIWGGPKNGWFIRESPIKMDDDCGYPYSRKPPYGGFNHLKYSFQWFSQQKMWIYTMKHRDISGCFLKFGDPGTPSHPWFHRALRPTGDINKKHNNEEHHFGTCWVNPDLS